MHTLPEMGSEPPSVVVYDIRLEFTVRLEYLGSPNLLDHACETSQDKGL